MLAFIETLDHPEMVGVNPEVAHEHMAGLNFLHGVAQALDSGKLFQPIAAGDRRVMAGSAGEQDDAVDRCGLVVRQTDFRARNVGLLPVETAAEGVFERARLLEDLLEHEVLEARFLRHDRRPRNLPRHAAHRSAVERRDPKTLPLEQRHFTVL